MPNILKSLKLQFKVGHFLNFKVMGPVKLMAGDIVNHNS